MKAAGGFALIELTTTLVLLALVSVVCALLLQSQAGLLRQEAERIATAEAVRTGRTALRGDLGGATVADVLTMASDSAALRAFRGWGIVCAQSGARAALRYRGLRDPDDSKDSLLLVRKDIVMAFRLSTSTALACAPQSDEQIIVIDTAAPLGDGAVALFFEPGIYHLSTDALRYHRPGESRQPLTDQLIDSRRSTFMLDADSSGVRVHMRALGSTLPDALGDTHIRFLRP